MKRFLLLFLSLSCVVGSSYAQLSTGSSTSSVIKTGNRPSAGDWGVYVGVAYSDFESIFSPDISFQGFPLVNVKHYTNDNLELRLGLQFQGTTISQSTKTTFEVETDGDGESYNESESTSVEEITTKTSTKTSDRVNRIRPGFAYHFSSSNLLDVYMGLDVPIGWNNRSVEYSNVSGYEDYNIVNKSVSTTPFSIGIGAFIGLQCFVADLPVAIGIEYGLTGIKEFGYDKIKTITTDADGERQVKYSTGTSGGSYDSLNSSRKEFSNDARITLTYYFKSK